MTPCKEPGMPNILVYLSGRGRRKDKATGAGWLSLMAGLLIHLSKGWNLIQRAVEPKEEV